MYKAAVFFDLDGTLLDDQKQVPPANLEAIAALKANHILPAISTGRNYWELTALRKQTGIETIIAANGADIFYEGDHLYQSTMAPALIDRLVTTGRAEGIDYAFYNSEDVALTAHTEATAQNYALVRQPQPRIEPTFYQNQAVCMLLTFIPHTPTGDQVGARYQAAFPELTFYRNSDFTYDVVNKDVSKASGLAILQAQADLNGIPTFAFGDGNNDISILQAATTGVAMGNALPQVTAVSDYQTADYLDAGIPKALAHFGLI